MGGIVHGVRRAPNDIGTKLEQTKLENGGKYGVKHALLHMRDIVGNEAALSKDGHPEVTEHNRRASVLVNEGVREGLDLGCRAEALVEGRNGGLARGVRDR